MKLIKVILRPERVLDLKDVLTRKGYHGISTKQSAGYGEQRKTVKQVYRGKIYQQRVDAVKRVELEFVVANYRVDSVIETIRNVTKTGQGADGRIYILPLDNAIHIHSGSRHLGDSTEPGFFDEI